ncbi:MAG: tetratricopeptide repeat protein [Candidatus Sericytochromatia bacterium]|nr:tetratricopeptide repeat protein [Candidatus Sericytochromatia bacterium]
MKKRLTILAILSLAFCAGHPPAHAGQLSARAAGSVIDGESLFKQGLQAAKNGSVEQARALFQRSLAATPEQIEPLVHIGIALADLGAYEFARSAFERALKLGPDDAAALNGLGYVYYRLDHHDDAILYYRKALLKKEDPQYRLNLGLALLAQSRWGQAEDEFRLAICGRPSDYWALNNLGYALQLQGRNSAAVAAFQAAIDKSTGDLTAHGNLGALLVAAEAWPQAARVYGNALKVDDTYADAHLGLANALTQMGKVDQAILELRVLSRLRAPSAPAHHLMAELYAHRNEISAARREAEQAVALSPEEATYYLTLGRIYDTLGLKNRAAGAFKRVLQLKPSTQEADSLRAWLRNYRVPDRYIPLASCNFHA